MSFISKKWDDAVASALQTLDCEFSSATIIADRPDGQSRWNVCRASDAAGKAQQDPMLTSVLRMLVTNYPHHYAFTTTSGVRGRFERSDIEGWREHYSEILLLQVAITGPGDANEFICALFPDTSEARDQAVAFKLVYA